MICVLLANFYFAAGNRGAKYYHQRVCVSGCPFATSRNFLYVLIMWSWIGPSLTKMQSLCSAGFVDEVKFARNVPYGAWLIGRILKVTHQGAEPGTKCDSTITFYSDVS